ncbi:MAG: hypothetical protein DRR16_16535 [Candidatus Parabeggiatoa sp. nov. 3]|nr:MAG: hypothetical protein DRR00_21295 [Gammaproteobacteria bacterium]RKZ62942.1 MAG: hypothetical protein DRQ99_17915 [Gammaproteobacteria bacterium]RKZ83750.1 MAG: hypothetical protein DRR16_16535 [Gammaproteobacteria bacterium]
MTDAPFAWHQRFEAVQGLQFTLSDLLHSDQILDTYIDALRIAKQAGACLHEDLDFEDWGAVFIGAILGLMFEDNELLGTTIAAIGDDLARAEELEYAIRWLTVHTTNKRIAQWREHENPAIRRAVFGALYADADPETLRNKPQHLRTQTHPVVLTRLLDIAGNQRHTAWASEIARLYDAELLDIRFHAIRAGILLGNAKAFSLLNKIRNEDGPYRANALELYLRAGKPKETQKAITEILESELSTHLQCQCVAWAGYSDFVPFIIRAMEYPLYARTAGYAFSRLTGVDIMEEDLDRELPEIDDKKTNASAEQKEDLYRHPNERDWPWPAPDKIQAWWEQQTLRFSPGTRYLAGYPITKPNLDSVLIHGTQPQRQAAALERSFLTLGVPVFDIKAYAPLQQQRLMTL